VTTNDVSPYLLRPVRKLEEAIAESEQQRLEAALAPPAPSTLSDASAPPSSGVVAVTKEET
jgi:hypothetical protein